jgi:DNA-directed RNA polymerase specialized sigma24 family protein
VTPHARAEIQALLKRPQSGDRAAIEPTFDVLWPILRRFSARALHHEADAEDAAQQALAKLFAQVSSFDSSRDGVAWALAIASFECRTIRRKSHRRREDSLEGEQTSNATPEALVIERDLQTAAREVLGMMKEDDANAILAAMADERPAGDATFRKRLERALGRLRLAWRTKHETP